MKRLLALVSLAALTACSNSTGPKLPDAAYWLPDSTQIGSIAGHWLTTNSPALGSDTWDTLHLTIDSSSSGVVGTVRFTKYRSDGVVGAPSPAYTHLVDSESYPLTENRYHFWVIPASKAANVIAFASQGAILKGTTRGTDASSAAFVTFTKEP